MAIRLVFMGTPEFAVPALAAIVGAGHEVIAVYTQPPRPAGRGMGERKSPVHGYAEARGIPVLTPTSLKGAGEREAFAAHDADAAVVVAYGLILPAPILKTPREGCLNVHASLLPRWRGAAPIQRAIIAGDAETGVTIMRMEEGLDTGPMCLTERVAIAPEATAGELHDQLSRLGAGLIVTALADLKRGVLRCVPQPAEGVTYAAKIDKAETRIDFSRPAREVVNLIRGLSPVPGAWFEAAPLSPARSGEKDSRRISTGDASPLGGEAGPKGRVRGPEAGQNIGEAVADGPRERIKVLAARLAEGTGSPGEVLDDALTIACGEGAVRLLRLQRAGKRPVEAEEFLRGFALEKRTKSNENRGSRSK